MLLTPLQLDRRQALGQESLRHSAGVFSRASVESWSNLFDSPHLLSLLLTGAVALILISQPLIPKLSYQRNSTPKLWAWG